MKTFATLQLPDHPRIVVVDDSPESLEMVCEILEAQGYHPEGFSCPHEAIASAEADRPDIILLDAVMPGIDGYATCEKLKESELLGEIPVLFISGVHEPFEKVRAFRVGAVDYLTKPFHAEEINARITTHLRLSLIRGDAKAKVRDLRSLVEQQKREVADSQMALVFALAKLSESRDYETGRHMDRIQSFCRILSLALRDEFGFEDQIDDQFLDDIGRTSALHDIGKVGIEDSILLKPGRLTDDEFDLMKRHTVIGAETLQTIYREYPSNRHLEMGIEIARSHHEKWDGSGYPDGLAGEEIHLAARIMALADVYDALRSRRPYKEPFSHEKAVSIISGDSGTHFDPTLVKAFLAHEQDFAATWDDYADEPGPPSES